MIRILVAMLLAATFANVQTDDRRYFDFWEGTWVREADGKPDTSKTVFRVTRGVNRNTFMEDWKQVFGDGVVMKATGSAHGMTPRKAGPMSGSAPLGTTSSGKAAKSTATGISIDGLILTGTSISPGKRGYRNPPRGSCASAKNPTTTATRGS